MHSLANDSLSSGAAIILTGGRSQRMGLPKALLPILDGNFLSVLLGRLRALDLRQLVVVAGPELYRWLSSAPFNYSLWRSTRNNTDNFNDEYQQNKGACSVFNQALLEKSLINKWSPEQLGGELERRCRKMVTQWPMEAEICLNSQVDRGPIGSLQVGLCRGVKNRDWVLVAHVDHPLVSLDTYRQLVAAARQGGASMWCPSYAGRRGHPVVFSQAVFADLLSVPEGEGARWAVARHREGRREIGVSDREVLHNVDTPEEYSRLVEEYGL